MWKINKFGLTSEINTYSMNLSKTPTLSLFVKTRHMSANVQNIALLKQDSGVSFLISHSWNFCSRGTIIKLSKAQLINIVNMGTTDNKTFGKNQVKCCCFKLYPVQANWDYWFCLFLMEPWRPSFLALRFYRS